MEIASELTRDLDCSLLGDPVLQSGDWLNGLCLRSNRGEERYTAVSPWRVARAQRDFRQVIPSLNELVGLPLATSPVEIDRASEMRFRVLRDKASGGDTRAQRELVALRIAYLNWAYPSQQAETGRQDRA